MKCGSHRFDGDKLWSLALEIRRQRGKQAADYIARQIDYSTETRSTEGAAIWGAIGKRLQILDREDACS